MDLLSENKLNRSNQEDKKRKILFLLVISIILAILVLLLMAVLSKSKSEDSSNTLEIDGKAVAITEGLFLDYQDNKKYINLKIFCDLMKYTYYNGKYMEYTEDKDKCYINNTKEIIGLEVGTDNIYKTSKINYDITSNDDYAFFDLSNKIIMYNDVMYICFEDLPVAFNLIIDNDVKTNKIQIYTLEYLINFYEKTLIESYGFTEVCKEYEDLKALNKGIIIANKNAMYGLLNTNYEEIAGNKYSSITYSEELNQFIVCSNGRCGVLDINGKQIVNVVYDKVEIIKDNNILVYKIKKNDKYGIIRSDVSAIGSLEYASIGTKNNTIINLEEIGNMIIVSQNHLYGLINLETGEEIFGCIVNNIYTENSNGLDSEVPYVSISIDEKIYNMKLNEYLEYLNTQQIVMQ